jgi:hypothetical protein
LAFDPVFIPLLIAILLYTVYTPTIVIDPTVIQRKVCKTAAGLQQTSVLLATNFRAPAAEAFVKTIFSNQSMAFGCNNRLNVILYVYSYFLNKNLFCSLSFHPSPPLPSS